MSCSKLDKKEVLLSECFAPNKEIEQVLNQIHKSFDEISNKLAQVRAKEAEVKKKNTPGY